MEILAWFILFSIVENNGSCRFSSEHCLHKSERHNQREDPEVRGALQTLRNDRISPEGRFLQEGGCHAVRKSTQHIPHVGFSELDICIYATHCKLTNPLKLSPSMVY